MPKMRRSLPKLPQLLDRKIYKTGQTRGADDDEIYQNRVSRTSTALFPYSFWKGRGLVLPMGEKAFENGYIVLISPPDYFGNPNIETDLKSSGLVLGHNALVFYETREQWNANNPDTLGWQAGQSRIAPLGGQYVARIPATTATDNGGKIIRGFSTTSNKGAGIRVYEYASSAAILQCRFQLEALVWLCSDSEAVAAQNGMPAVNATMRKAAILKEAQAQGLLEFDKLQHTRLINKQGKTICPLCLEELSAQGFFNRMQQAEGREVNDLTVTQLNLFHIEELRVGVFNHRPYNLGWGHHHCNVVVKDSGIKETIEWMAKVVKRNAEEYS
jgi:hypothetical protein